MHAMWSDWVDSDEFHQFPISWNLGFILVECAYTSVLMVSRHQYGTRLFNHALHFEFHEFKFHVAKFSIINYFRVRVNVKSVPESYSVAEIMFVFEIQRSYDLIHVTINCYCTQIKPSFVLVRIVLTSNVHHPDANMCVMSTILQQSARIHSTIRHPMHSMLQMVYLHRQSQFSIQYKSTSLKSATTVQYFKLLNRRFKKNHINFFRIFF